MKKILMIFIASLLLMNVITAQEEHRHHKNMNMDTVSTKSDFSGSVGVNISGIFQRYIFPNFYDYNPYPYYSTAIDNYFPFESLIEGEVRYKNHGLWAGVNGRKIDSSSSSDNQSSSTNKANIFSLNVGYQYHLNLNRSFALLPGIGINLNKSDAEQFSQYTYNGAISVYENNTKVKNTNIGVTLGVSYTLRKRITFMTRTALYLQDGESEIYNRSNNAGQGEIITRTSSTEKGIGTLIPTKVIIYFNFG
ncbi:MAG: hypothetical protein KBA06_03905 [Saprospiraceae bacterium]|nr:hypothetical protein [Saprospiraceae bacterium]